MRPLLVSLLLVVASVGRVAAQSPPVYATAVAPMPGSSITVTLVTLGSAKDVDERFGHNALWFHDASTMQDVAYQWGVFSFNEPGFYLRFLTGETNYWMGPEDARLFVEHYRNAGRPTTLQRLNLTPQQALALREYVRWNSLDANKFYRYDYFRDNCSTRLRDVLDRVLGGAIKRATDSVVTTFSYRSESVRLTNGDAPIQTGIDIALGRPADRPLTKWQSFFIPMRLRDAVRDIRVPGPGGVDVPLVAQEQIVPPAVTPIPEAAVTPNIVWRLGGLGVLLALLVVGLRVMMISRRSAAWGLALFGSAWSLLNGVIGVILLLAWMATKHVFWASNENVLLLTPFSLALVMLIPAAILSGRGERAARMVASIVAALALVAALLAIIPGGQDNLAIVAMFLPVHLALAWALALPRSVRRPTTA
ncbi:MAG: DUF4105 domain-containing protein [bacterium]